MVGLEQTMIMLAAVASKFIDSDETERRRMLKSDKYDSLDAYERQQEDMRAFNRMGRQ